MVGLSLLNLIFKVEGETESCLKGSWWIFDMNKENIHRIHKEHNQAA